jgi:hypothetical protein
VINCCGASGASHGTAPEQIQVTLTGGLSLMCEVAFDSGLELWTGSTLCGGQVIVFTLYCDANDGWILRVTRDIAPDGGLLWVGAVGNCSPFLWTFGDIVAHENDLLFCGLVEGDEVTASMTLAPP